MALPGAGPSVCGIPIGGCIAHIAAENPAGGGAMWIQVVGQQWQRRRSGRRKRALVRRPRSHQLIRLVTLFLSVEQQGLERSHYSGRRPSWRLLGLGPILDSSACINSDCVGACGAVTPSGYPVVARAILRLASLIARENREK